MVPGRHEEADRQRLVGGPRRRLRRRRPGRPPEPKELEALAVETDVELLGLAEPPPSQARGHDVLGVEREVVPHHRAAAAPERQVGADPAVLQPEPGHAVGGHRRAEGGVADGQPADPRGRRQVALEQRRRHRQHVGVVVEAVRPVVGREQGADVDLEAEQVPDGVGVLGPVETARRGPARSRVGGGGPVDGGLQPRREGRVAGRLGPRPPRRRHRPRPQLADDPLPRLGVATHVVEAVRLERKAAGLQPVVVAGHAVAVQQRAVLRGDRSRRAGGGLLGGRRRRRGRRLGQHEGADADQRGADEADRKGAASGLSHESCGVPLMIVTPDGGVHGEPPQDAFDPPCRRSKC